MSPGSTVNSRNKCDSPKAKHQGILFVNQYPLRSQRMWTDFRPSRLFSVGGEISLCRRQPSETFSRSVVVLLRNGIEFFLRYFINVDVSWQIAAQSSVSVFVRSALLGRARVTEVDPVFYVNSQCPEVLKFRPLVKGDCQKNHGLRLTRLNHIQDPINDRFALSILIFDQHTEPA